MKYPVENIILLKYINIEQEPGVKRIYQLAGHDLSLFIILIFPAFI